MSNWSKLDYFLPMALTLEANALVDIKGGKVATNNGAAKVAEGFQFDGLTNFINSNVQLFNSTNYSLNDSEVNAFQFANAISSGYVPLFGVSTPGFSSEIKLLSRLDGVGLAYINTNSLLSTGVGIIIDKQLTVIARTDSSNVEIILDGTQAVTDIKTSVSIPTGDLFIGSNNQESLDVPTLFYDGILSNFSIGASIGVNQVAKNDNYRQFLTDLGIDLTP